MITIIVLQQYFFYATGHENTFTSIRWEAVFHGLDGNSNNLFVRIISILFLLLSTYSSSVISVIYLILIIEKFSIDKKTETQSNANKQIYFLKFCFFISLKVSVRFFSSIFI